MKRFFSAAAIPLLLSIFVVVGWYLLHDVSIPVLQPQGIVGQQEKKLLVFTLLLSCVVVIPVFTMLGVFAWRYREGNKESTYKPEWSENKALELLWWGIPIIIIGVLSVITWQTSHSLDPHKRIESYKKGIEVQVVALQWKWLFIYPDQGVATVNQLYVPTNTPVHFTLSADAPMSAFWVPSLGSQIYSMNGMSSKLSLMSLKDGDYEGYNTNINGNGYADMNFIVHSVSDDTYTKWLTTTQNSSNILDESRYSTLAKPGVEKQASAYKLTNKDLYDTILMKYMTPTKKTTPSDKKSIDTTPSSAMDHSHTDGMDMSGMEGM